MTLIDQAIEILQLTRDGQVLSTGHLAIVEAAVNGRLSERGEVAFAELYAAVVNSQYSAPYLCGVANLTRDHEGYVYWRGRRVEHFSHRTYDAMRRAAVELAENCLLLESRGFPVNSRTATCPVLRTAPAGTPWLEALCNYYAFFRKGDAVRVVFYRCNKARDAVALEKRDGVVEGQVYEDGYEAYHGTIAQGYESAGCNLSYEGVMELLERSGLTPEDIHIALN